MLNEIKPEDVMRALEEMSAHGVYASPHFQQNILALLREKDAEIKGLVDGWSKDQDRFEKVCAEKDAEIERLKNRITFQVTMPDEKVEEIKSACLKRIDELGSQRWISVKDRFPKPYESVLVWGKDTGGVRWGMYSPNQSIWKDGTISHWMQLPKPPKTEDDFPNCKISGCEAARKDCHIDCPYGKENTHGSE